MAVLERIDTGDAVVFMGDAVLQMLVGGIWENRLKSLSSRSALYVLQDDIIIRGIAPDRLAEGIEIIEYSGLVTLTVDNKVIQSWC